MTIWSLLSLFWPLSPPYSLGSSCPVCLLLQHSKPFNTPRALAFAVPVVRFLPLIFAWWLLFNIQLRDYYSEGPLLTSLAKVPSHSRSRHPPPFPGAHSLSASFLHFIFCMGFSLSEIGGFSCIIGLLAFWFTFHFPHPSTRR